MKKLAWFIIFTSLILVIVILTTITIMFTKLMLEIYLSLAIYLLFVGIIIGISWAIIEVRKK